MVNDQATHEDRMRRLRQDIAQLCTNTKSKVVKDKWTRHLINLDELLRELTRNDP